MGIAYNAGTRGKLMRRAAARPSSLWWRSAVVHRWGWVRGAEEIINEDTESSCAFGQGHRSPALAGLCPCGGGKGGLLCFLSGDEVTWGCPLKTKSFSPCVGSQRRRRAHLLVAELYFWPSACLGDKSFPALLDEWVLYSPTDSSIERSWSQLRWFSGCWLKGQRRRVGWIPPEKQQEKKKTK